MASGGKKQIAQIVYRVLSDEDILRLSVVEVTNHGLFASNGTPKPHGLFDARMGSIRADVRCQSCRMTIIDCPGHYGYIRLAHPIYHPLFVHTVVKLLRSFCYVCAQPLATPKSSAEHETPEARFEAFYATARGRDCCAGCDVMKRTYSIHNCMIKADGATYVEARDVRLFLLQIDPALLRAVGLTVPVQALINDFVLVPPPCTRPVLIVNAVRSSSDDITMRLVDVLKITKRLIGISAPLQRLVLTAEIQYIMSVMCLGDSGPGRLKRPAFNSGEVLTAARAARFGKSHAMIAARGTVQSIHRRLVGKTGLLRGSLLGKRTNMNARTVATMLCGHPIDVVGVPRWMAAVLTKPERVYGRNLSVCTRLLRAGETSHVETDGVTILVDATNRHTIQLLPGDVVHRNLRDGDHVIVGRQPTVRKHSLLALRVCLVSGTTVRVNTAVTGVLGLDFDGDELNIAVMTGLEADAELVSIMHLEGQMLSAQTNASCFNLIQNSILAVWQLSGPVHGVDAAMYATLIGELGLADPPALSHLGLAILSRTLPPALCARCLHIVDGAFAPETPRIDKSGLRRLTHHIAFYVSPRAALDFMERVQRLASKYHSLIGATVGITDCMLTGAAQRHAETLLGRVVDEMARAEPVLDAVALTQVSSRLMAASAARLAMRDTSGCLLDMASSGSKGAIGNLVHISTVVGQQFVGGEPIAPLGSPAERGFVRHSYVSGLTMQEAFGHLVAARDGVPHTSVTTATTGYAWRKLSQALISAQVAYDRTVRYADGRIISLRYGGDGYDGARVLPGALPFDIVDLWDATGSGAPGGPPVDGAALTAAIERVRAAVDPLTDDGALVRHLLARLPTLQLSAHQLERCVAAAIERIERAVVEPGEMVGVLAGTMLGEPMQQMTLDSFHHAGAADAGADSGIGMLLDLINLRLKLPEFRTTYCQPTVLTRATHLTDLAAVAVRVVADVPDDSNRFQYFRSIRITSPRRLFVDVAPRRAGLSGAAIWRQLTRVNSAVAAACDTYVYPREDEGEQWLMLVLGSKATLTQIRALAELVSGCVVSGVAGLGRYVESVGNCHVHAGDAMLEVLAHGVHSAYSDSIATVYALLGIVGLEAYLFRRIRAIYKQSGVTVDPRHIRLLVDFMCFDGASPASLTRHSFNRTAGNTMTRASFEETSRHLAIAAAHHYDEAEPISSVNDAIVVGHTVRGGTHAFDLVSPPRPDATAATVPLVPRLRAPQPPMFSLVLDTECVLVVGHQRRGTDTTADPSLRGFTPFVGAHTTMYCPETGRMNMQALRRLCRL